MKKFFEAPVVSSVELTQEDVIMDSLIGETVTVTVPDNFADEVSENFEIWRGFSE